MRKLLLLALTAGTVAAVYFGRCPAENKTVPDVTQYLPDDSELTGWFASGDTQVARGEDLYLLIDGGAEIFLEFGFKDAVMQSYESENGASINLEIYEMENSSSAYGMYTFRRGEGCGEIAVGDGGCIEDYYLNFWKGNVLVTVIGFDSDEETIGGVRTIARAVAARITGEGERPRLTGLLPAEGLKPNGVKYLRGNLALYNFYEFDRTNIFGLSEGVVGTYEGYTIFLFSYRDETECRTWFLNGANRLKDSSRFHDFTRYENGCTMSDARGGRLRIEPHRSFIIAVLGAENSSMLIIEEQRSRLDDFK